jgi:hypothetical protein
MASSLNQFLILYAWFPLSALLIFAYLIARFFERFSDERVYARWFLLPVILAGASFVRYASIDRMTGDGLGDGLLAISGVLVFALSANLYRQMVIRRKQRQHD